MEALVWPERALHSMPGTHTSSCMHPMHMWYARMSRELLAGSCGRWARSHGVPGAVLGSGAGGAPTFCFFL